MRVITVTGIHTVDYVIVVNDDEVESAVARLEATHSGYVIQALIPEPLDFVLEEILPKEDDDL